MHSSMSNFDSCAAFQSQGVTPLPGPIPCHHHHHHHPLSLNPSMGAFRGEPSASKIAFAPSPISTDCRQKIRRQSTDAFPPSVHHLHHLHHTNILYTRGSLLSQLSSSSSLPLSSRKTMSTQSSSSCSTTAQMNDRTSSTSSSSPIFLTSTASNNEEYIEPDEQQQEEPPSPPPQDYDDINFNSINDIDDDAGGVVGELYNFDDDELLEMLSDLEGDVHYGIGELEELEEILREQLVLDEGVGWMDIGVDNEDFDDDDDENGNDNSISSSNRPLQGSLDTSSLPYSNEDSNPDTYNTGSTMDQSTYTIRSPLEEALYQGVVPATAGVGSKCLPGDYGFDPLGLATKDYFKQVQNFLLMLIPPVRDNGDEEGNDKQEEVKQQQQQKQLLQKTTTTATTTTSTTPTTYTDSSRPPALILRDYREAEIRHGRLAMLAAIIWPLQEIFDRLFIPQRFGETTMIYGGTTLPFLSLFMTLLMLLLGYLDIYANAIKDEDAGDAFLPGECFWDPLSMLVGASDDAKRIMQLRELNNGRWAMVAVFFYVVQETMTHQPLITLPWNEVLFEPAYVIPAVQAWLDERFAGYTLEVVDIKEMEVLPMVDYTIDGGAIGGSDAFVEKQ